MPTLPPEAPFASGGRAVRQKPLTHRHNAAEPSSNKICFRENVTRAFKIHQSKLKSIKEKSIAPKNTRGLKFLEDSISKSFHANESSKKIMEENAKLAKKLMRISAGRPTKQAAPGTATGGDKSVDLEASFDQTVGTSGSMAISTGGTATAAASAPTPASRSIPSVQSQLHALASAKTSARLRTQSRISRENLSILSRLNAVKPEYSTAKLLVQRVHEQKVLKLRSTDYTTGHIMPAEARFKESVLQRNLNQSSFISASSLALTKPILSTQLHHSSTTGSISSSNQSIPPIYVDPDALQFLPQSAPASRKSSRPKGRKKETSPPLTKPTSKSGRRSPKKGGKGRVSPTLSCHDSDDHSVQSSTTALTGAAITIFSGIKSFSVFGIEKDKTADCVVEVLMREPWDGNFLIRVVSKVEGMLASKTVACAAAQKLEGYYNSHQQNSQDIIELHELLTSLFMEADTTKTGSLMYEEFIRCMEKADLGISAPELRLVMAEADDNDDGVIDFEEFVPIAIDLIQAFKARASAARQQQNQAAQIDEEAIKQLYTGELDNTVKFLTGLLVDVDTRSSGTVSRQEFKNCINNPGTGLSKVEGKMIENEAPRDKFGRIIYKKISETVHKVRLTTIKNAIMETMATDVEKYIMDLCKEQERDDASDVTMTDLPDSEFPYTGSLTDRKIANLLQGANMLSMNRLQVLAIMCEADVIDGIVDYWKFVPVAAKCIEAMFEPGAMQQRAQLLEQSDTSDEALMHGKQREEVEEMVRVKFRQADVNKDGWLDPQEFTKVMESMELDLKRSEINALMTTGDLDGNGFIDLNEFLQLAYDQLLYLEKEKHIRELQSTIMAETNLLTEQGTNQNAKRSRTASTDQRDQDDRADEKAAELLEEMLINLFLKADWNSTGYLTAVEFREILESLDLGVTSFQQTILMAEADENEDGKIQYGEFVPVCAELLQAFKAKAAAEKEHKEAEFQIDTNVKLFMANSRNQLKLKTNSVVDALHAADPEGTEKLPRKKIISLLRANHNLEKSEVNMILHSLVSEEDSMTPYHGIDAIMQTVFEVNCKRKFQSELPHSSLESHLIQLLEDEERALREEEQRITAKEIEAVNDDTSVISEMSNPESPKHQQAEDRIKKIAGMKGGLESLDFDDDADDTTVLSLTAGFLPANRIFNALKGAKHLRLSRVQLLAVLSLSRVDESSIEEVPYRDFANTAAEMITKFFDPRESKRRALLEKRTDMNPLKLLNGLSRRDLEKRLLEQLQKIDSKKRGNVSEELFKQIVSKCLEQVQLHNGDYLSVIASAQRNSANRIIWKPFVDAVYDQVLHLKRERILHYGDESSLASTESLGSEVMLMVPPSTREQALITEAMFALVNIESRRGELSLAFEEDSRGAGVNEADVAGLKEKGAKRASTRASDIVSSHHKISPQQSNLALVSKGPSVLAKMQRVCVVVGESGECLNQLGEIFISGMKGSVQEFMNLYVVVSRNMNDEEDVEELEVRGYEQEGGKVVLEKIMRMPSIASADIDAALALAANLGSMVKVVDDGQGNRRFKF